MASQGGLTEFAPVAKAWPQAGKQINAIARAPDGNVLMTSDRGLLRIDGHDIKVEPLPSAIMDMPRQVRALSQARDGSVWLAFRQAFRLAGGTGVPLARTQAFREKKRTSVRSPRVPITACGLVTTTTRWRPSRMMEHARRSIRALQASPSDR